MSSVKFKKGFLHMDVLCAKQYLGYILAGIGNNLFVYKNATLLLSEPIFKDERIHSICIQNNLILIKGGRQLSLVKLETSPDFECEIISQIRSSDWIQDVIILENQLAGVVTAHNAFECWSHESGKLSSVSKCEETCILYSCKVTGESLQNATVFAGTVFGDVFIWSPSTKDNSLLHRLKAHNGAVFSIEVKPEEKLMTTTSDDRSLKVWSIIPKSHVMSTPKDWKESQIQLSHTLFGHTARVWRSMILPDFYLTAGEDSQLIVWTKDGKMMKTAFLHQESGIRALDYSGNTNVIATGGNDGGINAFSLSHLTSEPEAKKILDLGQSVSTKVAFTKQGLVYTLNGGCVMVSSGGEEVVYESEKFLAYCVLEVCLEGRYIAMGSIGGDLVVIDSDTKQILVEEQVSNGRVYSIHWLGSLMLTCGPEGKLNLWELSDKGLVRVNTMQLPEGRERWTTCGGIHSGQLVVGDRMGSVHVFELRGGENPVKSIRKIHSYLGVTDIKSIGGDCLSVGRDGTMKEFTGRLTLSTTDKLPMEWPWKIVDYEKGILILGFRGSSFIVWSMKTREVIASHDCGGGHRSCDYRIHKDELSFVYVKEKKVFLVVLPLDNVTRVRNGFHGREINCLKILKNDPPVIVTGSEDTTLRVSLIERTDVHQMLVLKTHISSIRTLSADHAETEKVTIVSAGGKGQIVVWDLDMKTLKCRETVNHRLRKEAHSWKSSSVSVDPETRIMCVDTLHSESEFLVAVGCSDCRIRLFSYSGELNPLCAIPYTHCVLKVVYLRVGSMRILASMGTDGKAVFWDVTDSRQDVSQLAGFSLHQSGINSAHFEEVGCGGFILATGGDDNLVSVAFVEIEGRTVNLRRVWESRKAHSCQVTGIKILKNFLVTASIDQRITVWEWAWREGEFTARFLDQYLTAVPDVQGMEATWENDSTILVAVHGKGLETLKIDVGNVRH